MSNASNTKQYKAYLRVRECGTRSIVHSVGVSNLSERHVEHVMMGMLHQINTDEYFVDDSEVDEARAKETR